jgi:hypothetical protein
MKRPQLKQLKYEVTNHDVLDLYSKILNAQGLKGTPLIYAVSRTIAKLRPVVDALSDEKCIPESEAHRTFTKELHDIHKKHSGGKMKTTTSNDGYTVEVYDFPWLSSKDHEQARQQWMSETKKLKEKFREAISEREKEIKEYNEFLNEAFPESLSDYIHLIKEEKLGGCTVPESIRDVLHYIVEQ